MNKLLKKIFLVDFRKGMLLTFRAQNPKYVYTEQYPLERPMVAERYRGAPRLNINPDTGETLCIACNLCSLACPENLIVVGWQRDDATRRKVLTTFTYDTSRCMFCGLCEDACPTDCLELTQDFEMATYSREGAIWDRHRLEEGPDPGALRSLIRLAAVHASCAHIAFVCLATIDSCLRYKECTLAPRSLSILAMELRKDPITRSWVRVGHPETCRMRPDAVVRSALAAIGKIATSSAIAR